MNRERKKAWATAAGITAAFALAYAGLRELPATQCGFLHYAPVETASGEVEFCATNHAGFLDLTRLDYPVELDVRTASEPKPGKRLNVTLDLATPGGAPMAPHELAVTHTKKMHVMLVDPSLEDYHHVHPEPEGATGRYTFSFRPERPGSYRVIAEMVSKRTRRKVVGHGTIDVPGAGRAKRFSPGDTARAGSLRFELNGPDAVEAGRDARFSLDVFNAEGEPAKLETIMGAKGHMVAFDYDERGYAHMHPFASIPFGADASGGDELAFLFNVREPGRYRIWAQIQHDGEEVFAPFDVRVQ